MSEEMIQVKDNRKRGFFMIDNAIIKDYGSKMGPFGIAVYNVLVMFADRNGENAFPSITTIQNMIGASRPKVIETINHLASVGMIKKTIRFKKNGAKTSTLYTITDIADIPLVNVAYQQNEAEDTTLVNAVDYPSKRGELDQYLYNNTPKENIVADCFAIASQQQPNIFSNSQKEISTSEEMRSSLLPDRNPLEDQDHTNIQENPLSPNCAAPLPPAAPAPARVVNLVSVGRFVPNDPAKNQSTSADKPAGKSKAKTGTKTQKAPKTKPGKQDDAKDSEQETPDTQKWFDAIFYITHRHQDTKLATKGEIIAIRTLAKTLRESGYTIDDLRTWYRDVWMTSFKGKQKGPNGETIFTTATIPQIRNGIGVTNKAKTEAPATLAVTPKNNPLNAFAQVFQGSEK